MPTATTPTPDPLLETQVFWMKHKNEIVIVLLVLLVAIAGYGAYRLYRAQGEAAAATMLGSAKTAADYQKVIAEHPGSGAAPSAALLLAAEQRKEQKFVDANATLQSFVDKNSTHQLVTTAKMAMAANFDSLGNPDQALEMYRRVAADYPKSFNAPLALLSQVPLLKQKGLIEDARRVCETVIAQYGDSFAAMEAKRILKSLKLPANAVAATPPAAPAAASPTAPQPGVEDPAVLEASVPPVAGSSPMPTP